jgi:hypothetical protein
LRHELGPSALASKLRRPLAAAASFDIALEEEHFGAEPVDAVVTVEEDVRATAPVDDLPTYEIDTNAHSVQLDIDTWVVTKTVVETTVILVDYVLPSTIKTPVHMSPPRYFPPSSRVFEPDKLTNCDKSGPCLVFFEACRCDILASKSRKKKE